MSVTKAFLKKLKELDEVLVKGQKLSNSMKMLLNNYEIDIHSVEKNSSILSRYQILLVDYTMWKSRKEYFEITTRFLKNKINGTDFRNEINHLRVQNNEEADELKTNLSLGSKINFNITSESVGFSAIVRSFQDYTELFDPDLEDSESSTYGLSENALKLIIESDIIPKFSKYSLD